jgi:hypothetical protein
MRPKPYLALGPRPASCQKSVGRGPPRFFPRIKVGYAGPTMKLLPVSLVFAALVGSGLALGSASAEDPKPCVKPTLPQVKAACDKGGQAEAKKMMKGIVDKGKAAGKEIKCLSCHKDLKAFEQTANAMADLKALL